MQHDEEQSADIVWTVGNENIGDEGVIRIAEALEKNTSLKELDLGSVFLRFCSASLFSLEDISCTSRISLI
jgi:Ni,Fe-hydrogenase maturation factor